VFGATFYDVLIQSGIWFAQMLSTAELPQFHSSLNTAAEDSIQESMLSGFALVSSSWLTVKM
jgi:hypothetical protein